MVLTNLYIRLVPVRDGGMFDSVLEIELCKVEEFHTPHQPVTSFIAVTCLQRYNDSRCI